MNFVRIDDKCKYVESYDFTLTNAQTNKLAIIIKSLLIKLSSNEINDVDSKYHVIANLGYRLVGGDYSTVRVIRANYERLMSSEIIDKNLIAIYEDVLSCIKSNKVNTIPISSINIRNGNFEHLQEKTNPVNIIEDSIVTTEKPVLTHTQSKSIEKTLKLELKPEI